MKIRISDSYCTYQYHLIGGDKYSIDDIRKAISDKTNIPYEEGILVDSFDLGEREQYQELVTKVAALIAARNSGAYGFEMDGVEQAIKPFLPPTPNDIADRLDKLADHHDAFGSMDTELRKIATDVRKMGVKG